MTPFYFRLNNALTYTLEFYEKKFIYDYLVYLEEKSKGSASHFHGSDRANFLERLYELMEEEISQVIYTNVGNAQAYFFELLKLWLNDPRIKSVDGISIVTTAFEYNDEKYADFEKEIKNKVEEFRNTEHFKTKKHKEEYTVNYGGGTSILGTYQFPYTTTKINYEFYCIEENPHLIDFAFLKEYITIVEKSINRFRSIIEHYTGLWDAGKIKPNNQIIFETTNVANTSLKFLEQPIDTYKKIKVNLSVPQLAYLFRLLYDSKIKVGSGSEPLFDIKSQAELFRFISASFITKGTDEISINSLTNHFTSPEKDTAIFLKPLLSKMVERARNL